GVMTSKTDVAAFISSLEQQQEENETNQALAKSVAENERLRRKSLTLAKDLRESLAEQEKLSIALDMITTIEDGHKKPPAWSQPPKKKSGHSAIPSLMLSDLHLDEVVNPSEVEGLNAYNREIAELRLEKTFTKA